MQLKREIELKKEALFVYRCCSLEKRAHWFLCNWEFFAKLVGKDHNNVRDDKENLNKIISLIISLPVELINEITSYYLDWELVNSSFLDRIHGNEGDEKKII